MLIDRFEFKETLADLWHEVFGDSYSFINLIFNKFYNGSILCFAEIEDQKVVSAFYLLKNTLKFDGKAYSGYYLYAAATLPSHRGKGLMSVLIKEAQLYCENEGLDFISLVPSEESLYNYYSRYGFESAFYKADISSDITDLKEVSAEEYFQVRSKLDIDFVNYDSGAFSYASESLKAAGAEFYRNEQGQYFIAVVDDDEIIECLPPDNCNGKKPFGMIFPINNKLKRKWNYTDIYMNIALD